ncbi:17374_t:CDS:2 [Cetraspora pellucida]|uniref:17374_t:CDS:1 n=1 Tax=Cetraspora pellucida TaxID=1433469 RepID=A0A9N9GEM3_9GLOM|nr:17374_t:CDS:2 [Cetraspora pellucida]
MANSTLKNRTTTSSKPTESSPFTPDSDQISLIFSKKYTFPVKKSNINYKTLPKFIDDTLRYLNTFNYPYEMFYVENGKEIAIKSKDSDAMKILKGLCESDTNIDKVYFIADKEGGITTFIYYNVDLLLLIVLILCLTWLTIIGSYESQMASSFFGIVLALRMFKYLR